MKKNNRRALDFEPPVRELKFGELGSERSRGAPGWLLLVCGWLAVGVVHTAWKSEVKSAEVSEVAVPEAPPLSILERVPPVDLDSASLPQLRSMPGLGPRRAVDYARMRWAQGGANFPPQAVPGIGPRTANGIRDATSWPPPRRITTR